MFWLLYQVTLCMCVPENQSMLARSTRNVKQPTVEYTTTLPNQTCQLGAGRLCPPDYPVNPTHWPYLSLSHCTSSSGQTPSEGYMLLLPYDWALETMSTRARLKTGVDPNFSLIWYYGMWSLACRQPFISSYTWSCQSLPPSNCWWGLTSMYKPQN